jgi:hypothetical protein
MENDSSYFETLAELFRSSRQIQYLILNLEKSIHESRVSHPQLTDALKTSLQCQRLILESMSRLGIIISLKYHGFLQF